MVENKKDWHIKCENQKKCTIFEDRNETSPAIMLDIIDDPYYIGENKYLGGHVELKKVGNFDILYAEAINKDYIRSSKLKIEKRRK